VACIEALHDCELFAGLDDDDMERIATIAHEEVYEAGEEIFAERDLADRLYILRAGRVKVHIRLRSTLEPDGDVTIEEVEAGRIFGWSCLVKQRRFTASVRALEPVTVLAIDAGELQTLFDQDAHIGFVVMKQLAEVIASRLRHIRTQLEEKAVGG
jgi:CRP-like cAMP-binding protein